MCLGPDAHSLDVPRIGGMKVQTITILTLALLCGVSLAQSTSSRKDATHTGITGMQDAIETMPSSSPPLMPGAPGASKEARHSGIARTSITQQFAETAGQSNLFVIHLSRTALAGTGSPATRKQAEFLITRYSSLQRMLAKAASKSGITTSPVLSARQSRDVAAFSGLRGVALDGTYARLLMQEHEKAITFYKAANLPPESPLRTYATKALPQLERSLRAARELSNQF